MANKKRQLILDEIHSELIRSNKLHPQFKSLHEAYAVILEEVDEFWDEVKKKDVIRDKENIKSELIQICAMCVKTIENFEL